MTTEETLQKNKALVLEYISAVGNKQFENFARFFQPDLHFIGPNKPLFTSEEYVAALKRLGTIVSRNDVKRIFAEGDEVCVIYDFVTDTEVGAVSTVEWVTVKDSKIASIHLIFDRHRWPEVIAEMNRRLQIHA